MTPEPLTCTGPGRRDCNCPKARHEHGTQLAYVRDRCRGDACRAANTARERVRTRAKLYGRYDGLVDAEPVRERIRRLSEQGVGLKQITRLSGVSGGVLTKLVYGQRRADGTHRPPSRRCTPRVRDRILAVPLDALAGGALVDGTGTRRRLRALVAVGWSKSKLARLLGMAPSNFGKTMRAERVVASTRDAVRALYDQLWDHPPQHATHHDKIAYSRALRYAAHHSYAPPLAWDDDTIDDPNSSPAIDADTVDDDLDEILIERLTTGTVTLPPNSRAPEMTEAVRRLAALGHTDALIAVRVGRGRDAVLKIRERNGIPNGNHHSARAGAA